MSSGTPSSVTTSRPSRCSGLRKHANTGWPSTNTAQQPQAPSGAQPFFGETTPHSSRRTSRKSIPGSYETVVGFPFSVKVSSGIVGTGTNAPLIQGYQNQPTYPPSGVDLSRST